MKNYFSIFLSILFFSLTNLAKAQEKFPPRHILMCYLQEDAGTKYKLVQLFSGTKEEKNISVLKVKGKNGRERTLKENEFATVSLDTNELTLIKKTGQDRFENNEIGIIITNYKLSESAAIVHINGKNIECERKY